MEIIFKINDSFSGSPGSRCFVNSVAKYLLNISKNKEVIDSLMGVFDKSFALQHVTLQEIILLNLVDVRRLDSFLKFSTVRNPYDRAFSLFNHWTKESKFNLGNVENLFHEFLNSIPERRSVMGKRHNEYAHFRNQVDYLRNTKGEIKDIQLIRLENFNQEMTNFIERNNLNQSLIDFNPLKRFLKESSDRMRDVALSNRNRELIRDKIFKEDFGYFSALGIYDI